MKKTVSLILCVVIAAFSLCSCASLDEGVALKLGDDVITTGQYNYILDATKRMMSSNMGIDADDENAWNSPVEGMSEEISYLQYVSASVLDEIEQVWFFSKDAEVNSLEFNQETFDNYKKMFEAQYAEGELDKKFEEWGITSEQADDIYKKFTYADSGFEKILNSEEALSGITDEQVQKQFDKNLEEFITVNLITVSYSDSDGAKSQEEAKSEIESAIKEIKDSGDPAANFDEIASKYGSETLEPYTFIHGGGQMFETIDDAAYSLKPGQLYSEAVDSSYAYHAIMRMETQVPEDYTLENQKENIRSQILYDDVMQVYKSWKKKIKINNELISKFVVEYVDKAYEK